MGHMGQASVGVGNNLLYLKFLEASQSAFESSETALKAAKEALTAAKIVHVEAKAALVTATEAFKAVSYKTSESEKTPCILTLGSDSEQEMADPDEAEEDFIMLSTEKDPIIDVEDDMSPTSPFLLITSTGPAADHQGDMLGLYRKTEKMEEGSSVYIQEQESKYGTSVSERKLFSHKGVWVTTLGDVFLRAATLSKSPTSVKWQYQEFSKDTWNDDPNLTVTGLSEKPSACEVTISLSQDVVTDIEDPGVAGLYRVDGSYRRGRPVLRHSGGLFTLSVWGMGWQVISGVGDDWYLELESRSVPSLCPADPRAARNERRGLTHWNYWSKETGMTESSGISVHCNKCIK